MWIDKFIVSVGSHQFHIMEYILREKRQEKYQSSNLVTCHNLNYPSISIYLAVLH